MMTSSTGLRLAPSHKTVYMLLCLAVCWVFLWIPQRVAHKMRESCPYIRTMKSVSDVCDLYHAKKISGPMCRSLCDHNHFTVRYCANDHSSEKSVLVADCNDRALGEHVDTVVIKIGIDRTKWQNTTDEILNAPEPLTEKLKKLRQLIKDKLLDHTGSSRFSRHDVLTMVLGKDFHSYVNDSSDDLLSHGATEAAIRTTVALVLQNEYMKLLAFREYDITPDLYGFCGPAYFLEHITPIVLTGHTLPFKAVIPELLRYRFRSRSWTERAQLALDLIRLVRRFEKDTDVLDLCDMRERNVGINSNNKLVLFDMDYTRYGLPTRSCEEDKDCSSGPCRGYCNSTTRTCTGKRKNNNLQVNIDMILSSRCGFH